MKVNRIISCNYYYTRDLDFFFEFFFLEKRKKFEQKKSNLYVFAH